MFSFFKKKPDTDIPEWASFFDGKEYVAFSTEVDRYFNSLNLQYTWGDGWIEVAENPYGFGKLGLVNVAQNCKLDNIRYYKEIISGHFGMMIKANEFDQEFQKIVDDFEAVKKYIGIRLYDEDYIDQVGKEKTIGRDFPGNLYAMIVFDLPDTVTSIQPEQIKPWNQTVDALFDIGIANIKANYPLQISKESMGDFDIWFVQAEHFFTPNIVFDLENKKELLGSKGALIGIPHRHSALIYPIENIDVVKAINGLIPVIYGMNQEGPGSLTNQLFWYHDQTFTVLPYKIEGDKLQFFPPENFLNVLNSLGNE